MLRTLFYVLNVRQAENFPRTCIHTLLYVRGLLVKEVCCPVRPPPQHDTRVEPMCPRPQHKVLVHIQDLIVWAKARDTPTVMFVWARRRHTRIVLVASICLCKQENATYALWVQAPGCENNKARENMSYIHVPIWPWCSRSDVAYKLCMYVCGRTYECMRIRGYKSCTTGAAYAMSSRMAHFALKCNETKYAACAGFQMYTNTCVVCIHRTNVPRCVHIQMYLDVYIYISWCSAHPIEMLLKERIHSS